MHFAHLREIFNHAVEQIGRAIAVLVLSPSQPNLKLHGIASLKPCDRLINPHLIVRVADIGPQSDFFDGCTRALLLTLPALVLVLTIVQDFGDRCLLIRRNDNQIKLGRFGLAECLRRVGKSKVIPFIVNQKNLR